MFSFDIVSLFNENLKPSEKYQNLLKTIETKRKVKYT